MEETSGFEYACGWNKFNFDLLGIWPKQNVTFFQKYRALMNAGSILFFLTLPRLAALWLFWGEVDAMIQCFSTHMPFAIGIVKFGVLHFRREVLAKFLKVMEVDWKLAMTETQFKNMMQMATIGRQISMISGSMAHAANTFGFVVQKWYNLESYYIPDPDSRLTMTLFWVVYVPVDADNTFNYIVLLLLQFYASCIGALIYCCFDSFIVMMILHLCGQLQIVQASLAEMGTNEPQKCNYFQAELRNIVQKHEELIRLAGDLEDSFNLVLFLALIACTLTFCFEGYALIRLLDQGQLNFFQVAFSVTVATGAFLHFFFCCWAGDLLIEQSAAVGEAIHNSEWYNLLYSDARSLMLIGFNRFRPSELTAGKFAVLSLSLFVNVVKTSMSYLSVLLAVHDST